MVRYVTTRLLSLIPVLILVALITFAILNFTPGDPTQAILGQDATDEQRADLRAELGLDLPMTQQFVNWASGLLTFDFGNSLYLRQPVREVLASRLEPTVLLAVKLGALHSADHPRPGTSCRLAESERGRRIHVIAGEPVTPANRPGCGYSRTRSSGLGIPTWPSASVASAMACFRLIRCRISMGSTTWTPSAPTGPNAWNPNRCW